MSDCHICNKELTTSKAMSAHVRQIHSEYYKTLIRECIELSKNNLSTNDIHEKLVRDLNCPFEKHFVRAILRKNSKSYICPVCNNGFLTRQGRHNHIHQISKNDDRHKKLYEEQFNIIEKNKNNLKSLKNNKKYILDLDYPRFYLRTINVNEFQCPACNLGFISEFSLKIHLKTYTSEGIFDLAHQNFIDKELEKIKKLSEEGLKYKQIYSKTILPTKFVSDFYRKIAAKINCPVCNMGFVDNQGLGNHLKNHPEYIDSLKQKVILLFDSNLTALQILEKENIPFRHGWVGEVWLEKFGKEKLKERLSKISSISQNRQYANGKKAWHKDKILIDPKLIIEIKKLFRSNISIEKISKNLNVSEQVIRKVWKLDGYNKKDLNLRNSKIAKHEHEIGKRKIWCNGKTSKTDIRIKKLSEKCSVTKIRQNLSNGIYTDNSIRESCEKREFNINKKIVMNNYNHICQSCNKKNARVAHHIIPHRISKSNALSNLFCICSKCHASFHGRIRRLEKGIMSFDEKCDLYINGLNDFIKGTL